MTDNYAGINNATKVMIGEVSISHETTTFG
jgi:hypothetical protein